MTTTTQAPAREKRSAAESPRLKQVLLLLGGVVLGLRVAWSDNSVVAAGVYAGVLGLPFC